MLERKTWFDFRADGLLWFANRFLHIFGWAIVIVMEEDGTISDCYPARCKFRGFDAKTETDNFEKVARYMRDNSKELYDEAEYPTPDATKPTDSQP